MTDAQIEAIARSYCQQIDVDPDEVHEWDMETVAHDGMIAGLDEEGTVVSVEHHRSPPRWTEYVETIRMIGSMMDLVIESRVKPALADHGPTAPGQTDG